MSYSSSWVNSTPANPCAVSVSPAANDVLLMWALNDGPAFTFSWPSGFTEIGTISTQAVDGQFLGVAIKNQASGSETSLSVGGDTVVAGVASFSGRDNASPQAFTASLTNSASLGSPISQDSNSVTPSADGTDLACICGTDVAGGVDVSPAFDYNPAAGGWTVRQDQNSGFYNGHLGTATQTTAAALVARETSTWTGGANAQVAEFLIGLKPASGAAAFIPEDVLHRPALMALLAH